MAAWCRQNRFGFGTLGVAAIHHGKRTRFSNVADQVHLMEQEKQPNKTGNLFKNGTYF